MVFSVAKVDDNHDAGGAGSCGPWTAGEIGVGIRACFGKIPDEPAMPIPSPTATQPNLRL
jgi:hypothetical protein